MRLSPPIPEVEISAAMTLVLVPPMVAPSGSSLGLPFLIIPISVVVPPMSMTTASLTPVRHMAPIRLAAGPDIIVSTGLRLASASLIMDPSPRTIMRGACMLYSASTVFMERMRSSMTGSRRAFMMHVTALSLNPRPDDRSCPQTAGMPRILSTMPLTRSSCSGFLTDRYPAMATLSMRPRMDSRNPSTVASSNGSVSSPRISWAPATLILKSAG